MLVARLLDPAFQASFGKIASPTAELPIRTAFKLKKMTTKIQEAVALYNERRDAILQKYALRKEDGSLDEKEVEGSDQKLVQLDLAKKDEWSKELEDLQTFDIELDTVTMADLGEKVQLSVGDLFQLDGLLAE